MKAIIERYKREYPKYLNTSIISRFKWILLGVRVCDWEYGYVGARNARKHKKNGNVQFVLWRVGDQKEVDGIGHTEEKWHDFDKSWWNQFIPDHGL